MLDRKNVYTYDGNGNLVINTNYTFNSGSVSWDNDHKYFYSYDVHGNVISDTSYYWDGTEWYSFGIDDYSYNANNDVAEEHE